MSQGETLEREFFGHLFIVADVTTLLAWSAVMLSKIHTVPSWGLGDLTQHANGTNEVKGEKCLKTKAMSASRQQAHIIQPDLSNRMNLNFHVALSASDIWVTGSCAHVKKEDKPPWGVGRLGSTPHLRL